MMKCKNERYIFRIDNGLTTLPHNEEKPYLKFCELAGIDPASFRFGWMQTLRSYFTSILHRDTGVCKYIIMKTNINSDVHIHDFDEYQTFMYYLEEFGEHDTYYDSDKSRYDILVDSYKSVTDSSLVQVIFDISTVDTIYETNSLEDYIFEVNKLGLSHMLVEDTPCVMRSDEDILMEVKDEK